MDSENLYEDFDERDRLIGTTLGAFEIKDELGRGGMGRVYLAERVDGEFAQTVAVKLIKRGMDTDFILKRFRNERQILANLDHPFIARLLDGGTTECDLPYFVMEYVSGKPLYEFCDAEKLTVRQRLEIFLQICEAVQYAHERKIIHRDLKPGNILVTAGGIPKLLDFGIAKLLDADAIHESINPTSGFMKLLTIEYASPEQLRACAPVTPATDVYSLGVMLYELLTGRRVYDLKKGSSHYEISRAVCEDEPEIPSIAAGREENFLADEMTAEKIAGLRRAGVASLQEELSGNLDRVIMKTLAKSPEDRYATVAAFAEDIERFIKGAAVLAKPVVPPEKGFQNTLEPVTGGNRSIAVLPLKFFNPAADDDTGDRFLGLGLADSLITRLSGVQRFVVRPTGSILRYGEKNYDPFLAGKELGVEYILDGNILKAGERIRVSVQLFNVAEKSTIWAEKFDEKIADALYLEDVISKRVAEALIPRLTAEERASLAKRGTNNPQAFEMYMRGRAFWDRFTPEGFAKAIELHETAIALDPEYALAYAGLAENYNWLGVLGIMPPFECFQKAKHYALRAIELDDGLSDAHAELGFAAVAGGCDWAHGEKECLRALELNPNNATAHVWYALQLFMEGRFAEGEYHARRGAELDPLTPYNVYNVGWCLYYARRYDDSIKEFRKTIALFPRYPLGHYGLGWTSRIIGDFETAIPAARKGVELSGDNPFSLIMYAQTLAAAGKEPEARELLGKLTDEQNIQFVSPYHLALIYCFFGEKENALNALEKSLERKEAWVVWMGVEPVFDMLKGEERFLNLLEATGNKNLKKIKSGTDPETSQIEKQNTQDFPADETDELSQPETVTVAKPNFIYIAAIVLGLIFFIGFGAYYLFAQ